jgi:hypothetical protein
VVLYTRNGSYPSELPHSIRLQDGRIRTNPSTFTETEIADAGYTLVPDPPEYNRLTEKLGWNGEWVVEDLPPPEPVREVTPVQAKRALNNAGLYEAALAAVQAAGVEAQIYWDSAKTFEFDNSWIQSIGTSLNLSQQDIQDLFDAAALL